MTPRLDPAVVLEHHEESGCHYLYHTKLGVYVTLDNEVALAVAARCDGAHSLGDMAHAISEQFVAAKSNEDIQADIVEMLRALQQEAFIVDASI